jgi:hypothetical protein
MIVEDKAISSLINHLKALEDEMREIRQRLESVERKIRSGEMVEDSSLKPVVHLKKINKVAKELVDTLDSAKKEVKSSPLELLIVPVVPAKIVEIKTVLTQHNY